jgi:hypothetical protein
MKAAEVSERLGVCMSMSMGLQKITQADRKGEVARQSMYVIQLFLGI